MKNTRQHPAAAHGAARFVPWRCIEWVVVLVLVGFSPLRAGGPATRHDIPKRLQAFVDRQEIAGAVTLVAEKGKILAFDAVGYADLESRRPMRKDNLFWIASMTKPMTAVCVLMLQDEGKLSVEDPVAKHLPEFKGMWMIEEKSTNRMSLLRPTRAITIRDLLTHTSGMGDVSAPRNDSTLAELAMAYAQQPLRFPPGSKWEYSNSGINTLGRIVEVAGGMAFADFLDSRLLRPLGMKDTTFWPQRSQAARMASSYRNRKDPPGLEKTPVYFIRGDLADRRRTPFPAGGLFSTAHDMANFYQMMLDRGAWKGKRLLSENAVAQMTRTQTGEIKTGFVDGMSWGFGFQVVKQPQGVTSMFSAGTFGHGGAYATQSWADPKLDAVFILMFQRAGLPNGDASEMRQVFQQSAVEALSPHP